MVAATGASLVGFSFGAEQNRAETTTTMIGLMVYDYGLVLNLAALPSGQLIARALALSLVFVVVVVALLRLHFGREESVSLARS